MDRLKTNQELQNQVKQFCEERDWDQFHGIKDLAIGISTESNELLDLFRFKTDSQIKELLNQEKFKLRVEQELADVFFFVLRLAQMNNIDLGSALVEKMKLNAAKYPVATSKGSNKKYNEE